MSAGDGGGQPEKMVPDTGIKAIKLCKSTFRLAISFAISST